MSNLKIRIFVCSVLCSLVCQVCPAIHTRVIHWYHDGMYSMGSPSLTPTLFQFHNPTDLFVLLVQTLTASSLTQDVTSSVDC